MSNPPKRADKPTIQNRTGLVAKPGGYTEVQKRVVAASAGVEEAYREAMISAVITKGGVYKSAGGWDSGVNIDRSKTFQMFLEIEEYGVNWYQTRDPAEHTAHARVDTMDGRDEAFTYLRTTLVLNNGSEWDIAAQIPEIGELGTFGTMIALVSTQPSLDEVIEKALDFTDSGAESLEEYVDLQERTDWGGWYGKEYRDLRNAGKTHQEALTKMRI
jgi:hypothetical protein